ncbi:MAG: prepilin-type N-terminal cleavage/methylation domain-containing protein [Betaproteobacteria bacterium]|nr:prepilin-type N-terminal cleavage/methylation domain-containing protein [Betaproteobacteria bacterium]MDH5219863.1 prepilin-type N-terminal cleavage/methylation domain-containing protein [Betaproteobacteria bacterium]MDH5349315.1 prepilin-type N-terminal cleavage/methylation domain-containing protein [Betaproteobacteria bacterium]
MRQEGFTLAEIAIVLVIIGLLVGSILKAQEMIVQARIKSVIADFAGLSAAYYGYQDRYRAMPGDDAGAGRWPPATPGDGNGLLGGAYNSAIPTDESRHWWDHLRRARFVSGAGAQQPSNSLAGMLGVQTGDGQVTPGMTLGGFAGLIFCSANVPDKISIAVDVQVDDGVGSTGAVRAMLESTSNQTVDNASAASAYVENGTNQYVLCRAL